MGEKAACWGKSRNRRSPFRDIFNPRISDLSCPALRSRSARGSARHGFYNYCTPVPFFEHHILAFCRRIDVAHQNRHQRRLAAELNESASACPRCWPATNSPFLEPSAELSSSAVLLTIIFAESCARFPESKEKVPHVGWNSLDIRPNSRLLAGVEPGEYVYFTHSYKAPVTDDTAATTYYIEPFASAVERGNVMGVQFHPEKSGATGLKILDNFLKWKVDE